MRNTFRLSGTGLAFMFLITSTGASVNRMAPALRGKVMYCRNNEQVPIVRAPVLLWDKFVEPSSETALVQTTDAGGSYLFQELTVGKTYFLYVDDWRYERPQAKEVLIESDTELQKEVICLLTAISPAARPSGVTFAKDSNEISPNQDFITLNILARSVKNSPRDTVILITGHHTNDERPSVAFDRANAVRDYFKKLGVLETQLMVRSLADSCPDEHETAAASRRASYTTISQKWTFLSDVPSMGCGPGARPKIHYANDFAVYQIDDVSKDELSITLGYSYDGRESADKPYIRVDAFDAKNRNLIAAATPTLRPGFHVVTLTLKKERDVKKGGSEAIDFMMMKDGVQFHLERVLYKKRWG